MNFNCTKLTDKAVANSVSGSDKVIINVDGYLKQATVNQIVNTFVFGDNLWQSSKTYAVGEYCIYNSSLWKCKVQHSGVEPADGTYWEETSISTEMATLNSNLNVKVSSFNSSTGVLALVSC